MSGWIKIHRDIKTHWIYENPDYLKAWMDLLLSVNHDSVRTSYGGQFIDVAAGSIVTSVQKLTDGWGWSSKSRTKRFLDLLVSDGMVKLRQNSKNNPNGTVITIVNWGVYQGAENSKRTVNGTAKEQYQNSKGADTYSIKEIKNEKNKENTPLSPKGIFENRAFSDKIKETVNEWLNYKTERREAYKPTGLKSFLSQVENKLKEFSEEQVIFAISESMASNYQGIVWDKAKRCVQNHPTEFSHNSDAYKCARYLDKRIRQNIPSFPKTNEDELQKWAAIFDELNNTDGQDWDNISDVLNYSQTNAFWRSKIQNAKTFKEKFFRLMGDMNEEK